MKRSSFLVGIALALVPISGTAGEAPSERPDIPLDRIWGYGIPGTRNAKELSPETPIDQLKGSREEILAQLDARLMTRIQRALMDSPKPGEQAGPAFVVRGTGREAMENMLVYLERQNKARKGEWKGGEWQERHFKPGEELTLVFYSYLCGRSVRIESVSKSPHRITVNYRFISHMTTGMSEHFALIPIGRLKDENDWYSVQIKRLEDEDEQGRLISPMRNADRYVGGSFKFAAEKPLSSQTSENPMRMSAFEIALALVSVATADYASIDPGGAASEPLTGRFHATDSRGLAAPVETIGATRYSRS
jgi:hypothetical protein